MKRRMILAFAMLMLVFAPGMLLRAEAATIVKSGTCGENLTWTLDSDGLLTISGTGSMTDYSYYSDTPWYSQRESIRSIVVEKGVTGIDYAAFSGCSALERMTIPFVGGSVKRATDTYQYPFGYIFGTRSYNGGTSTYQFYYGDSTSSTTSNTYYIPSSLKSVTVTGGNILFGAFYNCENLTSITLSEGISSIGYCAFFSCDSLSSIVIPDSVTSIGDYAFRYCDTLSSITIPEGVTSIGEYAFDACDSLSSITIPASVTGISNHAFSNCDSLSSVTIPEGVSSIGNYAFAYCGGLSSITMPASVTSIGSGAFYDCNSLEKVEIADIAAWCGINFASSSSNPLFYASNGLYMNSELLTDIVLPDSVTSISAYAFYSCDSLSSVTIPEGVSSIGDYVFYNCDGLSSITIPDSVTSIGSSAFYDCDSLNKMEITDIAAWCNIDFEDPWSNPLVYAGSGFYLNGELITNVILPDSVTSISAHAFSGCKSLTSITIPDSVTTIGEAAFSSCVNLTSIMLPDSVTSIGRLAFDRCTNLSSITLPANVTSIGGAVFQHCSNLTNITIPDSITRISDFMFSGCSSLTSITIPDSVATIGQYAFQTCMGLTSITIPASVTSIESNAFRYSSGLEKVEITDVAAWYSIDFGSTYGNPLQYASNGLYLNGEPITSVVFPDSVTSIPDYAFSNCGSLSSVTIPEGVTSIGDYAFNNCDSLAGITLPDSVTSIGDRAFYDCDSLSSITIPEGVTGIGDRAFYGCDSLSGITIPEGVTSIGSYAFENCDSLERVEITDVAAWCQISFGNNYSNPLYYADNGLYLNGEPITSVVLPDRVTSVPVYAFAHCTNLSSITIPDSVTSIGSAAFSGCSALESMTIPFVGGSVKTETDTYQYPFGYIFGTSSYIGGVAAEQRYHGYSTDYITQTTYYIPSSLKTVTVTGGNILCGAFYNCGNLTSITLPGGITSIGDRAFYDCDSISSITIPEGVTSIGASAFYDCDSISSITIPEGVTSIGASAFYDCASLSSITIPDSVTSIGSYAFENCGSLERVEITDVAAWCQISLGNNYSNPLYYADNGLYLNGEPITSVVLPDSVTSVPVYAFAHCTNLSSITIPDSVTSIGSSAFFGCSALESMTIPFVGGSVKTETDTYQYPFGYIFGTSSYTGGTLTYQPYYGSSTSSTTYDYYYIPSRLKSVTVTGGNILCGAFTNCGNLTSITLPGGITSIGEYAFYGCDSLSSITIPEGVTSIGNYAFYDCDSLSSITIPEGVTSIGASAFYDCASLSSITIPDSVTSIGSYAFAHCTNLSSITIPDSVTSMGSAAFSGCSALESMTIPFVGGSVKTAEDTYQYPFGYIFGTSSYTGGTATSQRYYGSSTSSTTGPTYYIPSSLKTVTVTGGNILCGAFYNCGNLTSITLPGDITSIGEYAFYSCDSLISVTISEGVTSIGEYAFYGCDSLSSITIPGSVTSIGDRAFYDCDSISSITIPEGVTSIGNRAFYGCDSLSGITIPEGVTSIGSYAFENCDSLERVEITDVAAWCQISFGNNYSNPLYYADNGLYLNGEPITSVVLPDSVTSVPVYAFAHCTNLSSITIPGSVTSIGDRAFYDCDSLSSITIPEGVTSIGNYAFYNCNSVTDVYYGGTESQWKSLSNRPVADWVHYNCASAENHWTAQTIPESCFEDGLSFDGCSCDYRRNEMVIPAIGKHDHIPVVTPPTCTEDGYTTYTCTVCGNTYTDDPVVMLGHDMADWFTTEEPTCTEEGSQRRDCTRCDYFETDVIPIIDHSYSPVITPPTCTEDGYTTYTCTVCGDTYTDDPVVMLGHDMGDWFVTEEPTCTQEGSRRKDCSRCDHFETEEIPATGVHNHGAVVTPPTCTADGYTTYTCPDCGDTYTADPVAKQGHDMGDWFTAEEPTCTQEGTKRRDCTRCDHFETDVIPVIDHSYSAAVTPPTCTEDGYTTYTCACGDTYTDDPVGKLGHSYSPVITPPSCVKDGYVTYVCAGCGDTYGNPVNRLGHDMGEWKTEKEPACAEAGSKRRVCSRCDHFETEEIPATGEHNHVAVVTAPNCAEDGYTTYTCSVCGDTYTADPVAKLGHDTGGWTPVKDPTCAEPGLKRKDCARCDHFETQEISATGEHNHVASVVAPTCVEDGYTAHICTECGDTYTTDPVDKLDHDMGDWVVVKEVTVHENGTECRYCGNCDYFESQDIEAYINYADLYLEGYVGEVFTVEVTSRYDFEFVLAGDHAEHVSSYLYSMSSIVIGSYASHCMGYKLVFSQPGQYMLSFVQGITGDTLYIAADISEVEPEESIPDEPVYDNPFEDVFEADYYYDPVLWAVDEGITNGMDATHFAPAGTCTRAQIVTFLWRANGSPTAGGTNPFTDVPADAWYTDAVLWAVEEGITTGTSATTFSPDAGCTRGQVATFLWRSQGQPWVGGENIFTDIDYGAYYYDAVLWAVENGITNGMGEGLFAPDATCTRGQIVTFLYRAMN